MKRFMRLSMVLAVAAMVLTGCNCFKKMAQNRDSVKISVTPELLTLKNGKVAADITVTFPAEYFDEKAVLKVTPVLVFKGGEVAASPKYYQGSKVEENYTVIDAATGGKVSQHVEFTYDDRMALSELQLRAEIKCSKGGCKEFTLLNLNSGELITKDQQAVLDGGDEALKLALLKSFGLKIAKGVNTLQNDFKFGGQDIATIYAPEVSTGDGAAVGAAQASTGSVKEASTNGAKAAENADAGKAAGYGAAAHSENKVANKGVQMMEVMANNYKRVTSQVNKADLRYEINSSKVTSANEKRADLGVFKSEVDKNIDNERASQSIAVKGYASPDGPETDNEELSKARSKSGQAVVARLLRGTGLEADAAAYGEDWEGFKELVEKSDIKDKSLILQVLSLYNSPAEREQEIKNMSSVYTEIKDDILPELRRAQIINTVDYQGNTDEEIMQLYRDGRTLTVEEYLHAAENVTTDPAEQLSMLTAASKQYPEDSRVWNNLAVAQMGAGDAASALASAERAASLATSPEITKNLVITNLANGRLDEAKKYAAVSDAEAQGAVAAVEGNYKAAAQSLAGYNAAIAHVLNNNYAAAKREIANDHSADADYLRAVIAAKEGDITAARTELDNAIGKNPALAEKAARDINLIEVVE